MTPRPDPVKNLGQLALDRIPVRECGEALVEIPSDHPRIVVPDEVRSELAFRGRGIGESGYQLYVREGVWSRLQEALTRLPQGTGLMIVEGFRPYALQKRLFDRWVGDLMAADPALGREEAEIQASAFVSDPDRYSPHLTGGALDVGMVELDSMTLVDVGNAYQYDASAATAAAGLTAEQAARRSELCAIMAYAELVNYEGEWWHFSYGDALWALLSGKEAAIYGVIKDPDALIAG